MVGWTALPLVTTSANTVSFPARSVVEGVHSFRHPASFSVATKSRTGLWCQVPLGNKFNPFIPPDKQFTPAKLIQQLAAKGYKVGLVIDLTNSWRYYHPDEFTELGVQHMKVCSIYVSQLLYAQCISAGFEEAYYGYRYSAAVGVRRLNQRLSTNSASK